MIKPRVMLQLYADSIGTCWNNPSTGTGAFDATARVELAKKHGYET